MMMLFPLPAVMLSVAPAPPMITFPPLPARMVPRGVRRRAGSPDDVVLPVARLDDRGAGLAHQRARARDRPQAAIRVVRDRPVAADDHVVPGPGHTHGDRARTRATQHHVVAFT